MRISDWSSDVCSSDLFHWKSNARGENDPDRVHPAGSGRDQESGVARSPPDGDDRGDGHHHDLDARDPLPRHRFDLRRARQGAAVARRLTPKKTRPEEDTSELQSLLRIPDAVFCLQKKITSN